MQVKLSKLYEQIAILITFSTAFATIVWMSFFSSSV